MANVYIDNSKCNCLREKMKEFPMYKEIELPESKTGLINQLVDDIIKFDSMLKIINEEPDVFDQP